VKTFASSASRVAFVIALLLVGSSLAAEVRGQGHFAKVDGARVHYVSEGKGREALVFIHGWACNLTFWKPQIDAFKNKTRVIAIDLPGHGESDKPQIDYTMDLFARAIDAVLVDAGIDRAVLVGHSMGTPVIRQFYRKYPVKTIGLVIVDGALRPMADQATIAKFTEPLRGQDYKTNAAKFLQGMLAPVSSDALREQIKAAMLSTPQHVAVSAMDGMNVRANYREDPIDTPVLAIMAKSPFWPADNEQFYRKIAPKIDYQMWEGVSHFLMMDKPDEFNRAVETFLRKNGLLLKK
jgi:pimeloyl-ACP methyl ester carboxylesterase